MLCYRSLEGIQSWRTWCQFVHIDSSLILSLSECSCICGKGHPSWSVPTGRADAKVQKKISQNFDILTQIFTDTLSSFPGQDTLSKHQIGASIVLTWVPWILNSWQHNICECTAHHFPFGWSFHSYWMVSFRVYIIRVQRNSAGVVPGSQWEQAHCTELSCL